MNQFLEEFKKFAVRGNVMDLAIGVVIGGAFGSIVSSLVSDIIMPPFGLALSGIDLKNLKWILKPAVGAAQPVILSYGNFLQNILNFLIISIAIFLLVKLINRLHRKEEKKLEQEKAAAAPSEEAVLLKEIRDLLKHSTRKD